MQEDKQTIDIDTSGPGAEIELPEEKDEKVVDQPTEKEIDKTYENDVKQSLKTIISPMIHLRNLMSSLMFLKLRLTGVISNKIKVKNLKNILKALKKG